MSPKGHVLIIEADEWISTLLVKFLEDAGWRCSVAVEAREGFALARSERPSCIICDVKLPDIDGFWVARRLRGERGALGGTPFAFITEEDNPELRLLGLSYGADVFFSPPFRHEEVVAQVQALIGMAARLRDDSVGDTTPPSSTQMALRGDIAQLSVPTLLTMLEMERRTGRLKVSQRRGNAAIFELQGGLLQRTELGGKPLDAVSVMRQAANWQKGTFVFEPVAIASGASPKPIGPVLLEAMRLNDEETR